MLTDFGLSRMLDDSLNNLETTKQFQGSIPWCSPELFEEEECIRSPASDVWAWAWLVYEVSVLTGFIIPLNTTITSQPFKTGNYRKGPLQQRLQPSQNYL